MSASNSSISTRSGKDQVGFRETESTSPRNEHEVNDKPKRTIANQRLDNYRIAFYGSAAQKEAHRQQIRAALKEQVKEKDDLHRKQLIDRVAESDQVVALDKKCKQEDLESHQKKAMYLKQFSNENKKIMEEKEKNSRRRREVETEHERQLLDMNPINWNMTLH